MNKPLALIIIAFLFTLAFIPASLVDDPLGDNAPFSDAFGHLSTITNAFFDPGCRQVWILFSPPETPCFPPQAALSTASSRAPPELA
jgi:hypothetical protein